MAKYDNLLEQDFYKLFGKEIVDKELSNFGTTAIGKQSRKDFFKGNKLLKAIVLLSIIKYHLPDDKELYKAYREQDIRRYLVME